MNYRLLDGISSPEDLKALDRKEIPGLCAEIRTFLIDRVEHMGGHLASNLGVTELTVAIHRVFDSPKDHIIFDVGHQAYVHKMLTGRRDMFDTLRTPGGLSGFTLRRESEHDPFGAGHSSTSISAALGFAEADRLEGRDATTVCVIGDGAYTGGMVHEALNNCRPELPLVIILNENRMSISKNRGAFARYIAKVRISGGYMRWKRNTKGRLARLPVLGKPIYAVLSFVKNTIKKIFYSKNYFEELGLDYLGPVDGNDFEKLEPVLAEAKARHRCVVVHVQTKKGKGYDLAEKSPDDFHSVSVSSRKAEPRFHEVFANDLAAMAESDPHIIAVTAAMGIGTGLDAFGKRFPKRYFDVGIAEPHALTFSAGLAAAGEKPFVAIYSTFLQRGYDNILHDIALQKLPVRIMIDRAGLAVADGATHHGIFDVAFLSGIPGMTILAPATFASLHTAMREAKESALPIAIRYPNAAENPAILSAFPSGEQNRLSFRTDFSGKAPERLFITYGQITGRVLQAKQLLLRRGTEVGVLLLERLAPYDPVADSILPLLRDARHIVFVEEGIKNGGAAMILKEKLSDRIFARMEIAAIDNSFASPTRSCDLYDYVGLSAEKLAAHFYRKI